MKQSIKSIFLLFFILFFFSHQELFASAARIITTDSCITTVKIQSQFNLHEGSYAIKEILPSGLYPYHIQQNGIWDENDNTIIWGAFPDRNDREFIYNVSGNAISYSISGLISIDGLSQTIDGNQQLTPVNCDLSFVSDTMSTGQLEIQYQEQILAEGGFYPLSFSIISGELPPGLELSSTSGTIVGIPEQTGRYLFTILISDHQNTMIQKDFLIGITEQLIFGNNVLFNVSETSISSLSIQASGGKQPYTISQIDGTLPPGITLESDGKLTGTFTSSGEYEFSVNLSDAHKNSVDQVFAIHVYDPTIFGSAKRHIEIQECASRVTIKTQMPLIQGAYAIMELLPDGVLPYSINNNGFWDTDNNNIIWGGLS